MSHKILAYGVVALLAVGAGVAVAGLPDNEPVAATIVISAAPASTVPIPSTSVTPSTSVAPATEGPTTTVAAATTSVSPTTTSVLPLPDRSEVVSATANGSGLQGSASRVAEFLETLGYVDVGQFNGTELVDLTVVYYADGSEQAAARMAADLDLLPEFVGPMVDAPPVLGLGLTQLLVYVGRDRG